MMTLRGGATTLAIVLTASFTAAPQGPALAQSEAGIGGAEPVCMARTTGDGREFSIIVPATDAGAMRAKGFEPAPCAEEFGSQARREAWRDSICEIASAWREDLQEHFERERGERPAVLCGMAEVIVGQWDRNSRK